MNPKVDKYLAEGCGRCSLYKTPECKAIRWHEELQVLREIVLACGLGEELKWSQPCYTLDDKNVLMVTAFKDYAAINFFKGSLLKDAEGILQQPGENSQAARMMKFTSKKEIAGLKSVIKSYVQEAIEAEKAGLKVDFKKTSDYDLPEELIMKFEDDPVFKQAFEALTPGRQRGYLLHFTGAKQSKTRKSRIEKCAPRIFEGKGWNER